jgi:hypothetical protein
MNTAVDDEVIGRNPCRIKGAGVEPTPERPVIGVEAVIALADAVPERYRTLILLATFGCLRWGELWACASPTSTSTRRRSASSALSLRLAASWSSRSQRPQLVSGPIALPRSLMPEIARHLDRFCGGRT